MSTQQLRVAVGGENLIDFFRKDTGDEGLPGGSPFNVAMGLGRQQIPVTYVTPISTDSWGDMLAERLVQSNVVIGTPRRDEPTSMAIVTLVDGIPSYEFKRHNTAERMVSRAQVDAAIPEGCEILHVGSLALGDAPDGPIWEETCAQVAARGGFVSIDPNLRLGIIEDRAGYFARLFRVLEHAHLVKISDEDLEGLFPELGFEAAVDTLRARTSARLVVITRGREDGIAFIDEERFALEVIKADPLVDTVGAGDTFMATLIAAFANAPISARHMLENLDGDQLAKVLRRASVAAAINCARKGCNPPNLDELEGALPG